MLHPFPCGTVHPSSHFFVEETDKWLDEIEKTYGLAIREQCNDKLIALLRDEPMEVYLDKILEGCLILVAVFSIEGEVAGVEVYLDDNDMREGVRRWFEQRDISPAFGEYEQGKFDHGYFKVRVFWKAPPIPRGLQ